MAQRPWRPLRGTTARWGSGEGSGFRFGKYVVDGVLGTREVMAVGQILGEG